MTDEPRKTDLENRAQYQAKLDEYKNLTEQTNVLWAIEQLAEMLESSHGDAAYQDLKDSEWSAIGIAIRRMAAFVHDDVTRRWEDAGEEIDALSVPQPIS